MTSNSRVRPGFVPASVSRALRITAEDLRYWFQETSARACDAGFLLAGPIGSGKTATLASLSQAARNRSRVASEPPVRVRPLSKSMIDLEATGARTIQEGRLPVDATIAVHDLEFELTLEPAESSLLTRRLAVRCQVADGPGGVLFGERGRGEDKNAGADREKMLSRLRDGIGLLLFFATTRQEHGEPGRILLLERRKELHGCAILGRKAPGSRKFGSTCRIAAARHAMSRRM